MKKHLVIIGGGNAGISVASQILKKDQSITVSIIEPSDKHYYQPAWTLVGAGEFDIHKTERTEESVMPKKATWIKQKAESIEADINTIKLYDGTNINYDALIIATGIQLNWDQIKGLQETIGKNGVTSNYSFQYAPYTFDLIRNLKSGKAIFHNPHTPVKCGGAPHKIMYLAADYFRNNNTLKDIKIEYWSGGTRLFAVPKYEKTLINVVNRNNIELNFLQKLVEIDGENKKAKFIGIGENNKDQTTWVNFDMIHVTPPQSAPEFIAKSNLGNAGGWVNVDKETLQHVNHKNIFSLGDSSGLPTSKTGAAIRKQAPVVAENIISFLNKKPLNARYNGYTSCPVITGYGKLVLAEFDYNNIPMETFPFDQSKERWSMYQLKKHVLPWLYWHKILTGEM